MRPTLALAVLLPLLGGCADPGSMSFRGRPLSVTDAASRLNDAAYSAGARTGERLGISPPADTPAAGVWRERPSWNEPREPRQY
ncbi:hypothetical protein [Sabulicella glaciei]|uniref:Uncharacterized protein n=1 Tax=Sabulicella glaciei TaxID=2984948 RepID=A0ABT3NTF0_9PROT|nr:hypothetical protein [Roseococcus sp. MDT2-1-1]MCW8085438.1 hypothetical protein [Roseococcus sp. MDT2-1-1]